MYKKIYNNVKTHSFDLMIRDALIEADPILKISDRVASCEDYLTLSDFITHEIKMSNEPGLEKAK